MRGALAYVRVPPHADEALSLDAQREALTAYATFKGLRLVDTYVDDDVPGGIPLVARPQGTKLVERLRRHDPKGAALLVTRLELLFSSAGECVTHEREWREHGHELHVLDVAGNPVSTGTLEGRFMVSVLEVAQRMEAQPAKDRAHPAPHHDRPKLGERVVRGFVVPDPDELRAVERIQELARAGKSLRLIAEALDDEGVPTKRRANGWSKEAIRLILRRIEGGEVPSLQKRGGPDSDGSPV